MVIFQEILPFVQILVNHGVTDRKAMIRHLKMIGYKNIEPSTVSRCLIGLDYEKNDKESKRRRKRDQLNLEIQLLKLLDNRKIITTDFYFHKIHKIFQERSVRLEINKETVKILVIFAKRGKKEWDGLFDKIGEIIEMRGNLETKSAYFELKRYIDKNAGGNIAITLADLKKSLLCLERYNWELFHYYRSLRMSIFLIEKRYLNRSEVVLSFTEKVNKSIQLPFQRKIKPYEVRSSFDNMAKKKIIAFPDSHSAKIKKTVSRIYKQSQKLAQQLFLYPDIEKLQKQPEFQLLNRIIIIHLHEFFKFSPRRAAYFHWWYEHGKNAVNDLQHDLLKSGRRSKLFFELLRVKTLHKDKEVFLQELSPLMGINNQQLHILGGKEEAGVFLFSLLNFLMKYFLGANHFRLEKGEYGFIPIYTEDDLQRKFDSYAEGMHMGHFQTLEWLREINGKKSLRSQIRHKKIFMDIFLGELLEASIVKILIDKTAPRTVTHKLGESVLEEMENHQVIGEKAVLMIIAAIKKSIFFSDYKKALNYLKDLYTSSHEKELRGALEENWKEMIANSGYMGTTTNKEVITSDFVLEYLKKKIDELVSLGQELLFPQESNYEHNSIYP